MKKNIFLIIILVCSLLLLAGCGDNHSNSGLSAIEERGVLRVGVKVDVPGFGYKNPNTGELEGMEVDLAKLLAKDIIGSEGQVEFVGVTAQTRGSLLDNDELDMVIATFTITDERKESYNFTSPYFTDEIGFLVKKSNGFTDIKSLNGKTIGVAESATTKEALEKKASELGITFQYQEYTSYPEIKSAVLSGRADAFSVDKSILLGYVDDETQILAEGFNPQAYGIATKKANESLAEYLEEKITEYQNNGELNKLFEKWGLTK